MVRHHPRHARAVKCMTVERRSQAERSLADPQTFQERRRAVQRKTVPLSCAVQLGARPSSPYSWTERKPRETVDRGLEKQELYLVRGGNEAVAAFILRGRW